MVNKIDDMSFFMERDRNKIFLYVRGLRYKFDESSFVFVVFIYFASEKIFFRNNARGILLN